MRPNPSELPARARRLLLVYLLALGVLAGPAYTMYVHYDFSHSLDTRSYLSIARGEFRGQSLTRRYRVLVPTVAAVVAWPVARVYARIWPQRAATEWPLRLAFYLVNTALLAAAGVVFYRSALLYEAAPAAAALAMMAVLSSRWAVYIAGLPLVDSLYVLVFALAFYGVRARSAGALVAVLLLGPLAKESFVFLVPWLGWFGRAALPGSRQLAWLAVGGALALAVRHWIDLRAGTPPAASVTNALDHFENVSYSLSRLFSVKGVGEIFSIFGFFWLALPAGAGRPGLAPLGAPAGWFIGVIIIHMLLSSELARMGYLAAPVFAVALARVLTRQRWLDANSPAAAVPGTD